MPGGRSAGSCQALSVQFDRVGVEHVEDVAVLATADLDADGIDQDEVLQAWVAGDGEFGRDPAAEAEAGDGEIAFGHVVQHIEIEVTRSYIVSKSDGSGEAPKPGCDGAMT